MSEALVDPPVKEEGVPLDGPDLEVFSNLFKAPDDPVEPPAEPVKSEPVKEPSKEKPIIEPDLPKNEPIIVEKDKAAPEPELEDKAPEGLSPKAGTAWQKKNETIKTLKAEVASVKETVAQTEQKFAGYLAPDKAKELQNQLQDAQAKLDQQETVITKIKHERHPEYQKSVAVPLERSLKKQAELAERTGIDKTALAIAISSQDRAKMSNLIVDMDELDRAEASRIFTNYGEIMAEKAERDAKAGEELTQWEEMSKKEQDYAMTQQQQARTRDIEERLPNVEKRFMKYADSDEAKGVLKVAVDIAKQDVMWQKEPAIQAAAAVALAMSPFLMKKNDVLTDEVAALKAQLTGYRKTEPGAGGGPQPSSQAIPDDDDNLDIIGNIKRNAVPIGQR